ncbi:MAG: arsenate reductase (glutaredoxin) [Candidatus Polarisedimenticolaceae bacterium]|nr:arsenate reductase (glutaredoxin) [Candidatus Polarisedimenticolaceae bacterium]
MSKKITIIHNPRCSKSCATLKLIQDREPKIVEYLKTPPTAEYLSEVLDMLKMEPRDLMRKGESEYKDNNLADTALSRNELIAAMVANPILIERPIVIANGKAAIGRPPESILDIL